MNFCGSRIKTEIPELETTKKLELLEVQKGMWKCEKQAIEDHNAQVRLQDKGVVLSTPPPICTGFPTSGSSDAAGP